MTAVDHAEAGPGMKDSENVPLLFTVTDTQYLHKKQNSEKFVNIVKMKGLLSGLDHVFNSVVRQTAFPIADGCDLVIVRR